MCFQWRFQVSEDVGNWPHEDVKDWPHVGIAIRPHVIWGSSGMIISSSFNLDPAGLVAGPFARAGGVAAQSFRVHCGTDCESLYVLRISP